MGGYKVSTFHERHTNADKNCKSLSIKALLTKTLSPKLGLLCMRINCFSRRDILAFFKVGLHTWRQFHVTETYSI